MTGREQRLLNLVEEYLRVWRCNSCGGRWLTSRSERALFHQCEPGRARSLFAARSLDREQETQEWARSILGDELVRSIEEKDEDALLRRLDE